MFDSRPLTGFYKFDSRSFKFCFVFFIMSLSIDGFVAFRRGELLCGNLGKKTLGGESKSGLFYVLIRDFGALEATTCMSRLSKLCARFLGEFSPLPHLLF